MVCRLGHKKEEDQRLFKVVGLYFETLQTLQTSNGWAGVFLPLKGRTHTGVHSSEIITNNNKQYYFHLIQVFHILTINTNYTPLSAVYTSKFIHK